jgi:ATP-dependent RNA helicase DeaD
MSSFSDLGLSSQLLVSIEGLGYKQPTLIQEKVIPFLLSGKEDLVALAQTGTGKTAAFGLPLIDLVDAGQFCVQGLILAPTRELCLQITGDLNRFLGEEPHLNIVAVYGGASIQEQVRALKRNAHIVVATPGRLVDLLDRRAIKLDDIKILVLDEADEMLNMGFQEDLDSIISSCSSSRNTWLFSATMPNSVRNLARNYMVKPVEIQAGEKNSGNVNIEHRYCIVQEKDKYAALKRLLDFNPSIYALIFCRTRMDTQDVADNLMKDGYTSGALHGDMDQKQREKIMDKFRNRALRILVATDVAARGLDVSGLTHVIHMNIPDELPFYTHRSGRTGRAGEKGVSIALVTNRDAYKIRNIESLSKIHFRPFPVPSGQEVCQQQLLELLRRVKEVELNDDELDTFLPDVLHFLKDMSREDLIKRFASLEFNRFLEYYRNAPDLNPVSRDRDRGDRDRRQSSSSYGNSSSSEGRNSSVPMSSFVLNLGSKDNLDKGGLLRIICEAGGIHKSKVGRIVTGNVTSTLELPMDTFIQIQKKIAKTRFRGRPLVLEQARAKQDGGDFARKFADGEDKSEKKKKLRDKLTIVQDLQ